jgi:hypothetical protein
MGKVVCGADRSVPHTVPIWALTVIETSGPPNLRRPPPTGMLSRVGDAC